MKSFFLKFLPIIFIAGVHFHVFAQMQGPLDIALAEINNNYTESGLQKSDIADMHVNDITFDKTTGISRVYLQQKHAGIKVFGAFLNLSINAQGKVFFRGNQFIPNFAQQVSAVLPTISVQQALEKNFAELGLPHFALKLKKQEGTRRFVFEKNEALRSDVKAELCYVLHEGKVHLTWMAEIRPATGAASWRIFTDAGTGEIIRQKDETLHCVFNHGDFHNHDNCTSETREFGSVKETLELQNTATTMLTDNAQYRVFPLPVESPAHGSGELVVNPAYAPASPHGWHDTNGASGPEYNITRGNNVWAWEDRDGNSVTNNQEPNGGTDLIFDFPFDESDEPSEYIPFATTNLFYMVNVMHDFAYAMGFDEAAGNFQVNNYGNSGIEGDEVYALAQQNANNGSINNALFSPSVDGERSFIEMFLWDETSGAQLLTVNEPEGLAGTYGTGVTLNWGAEITDTPVSGEVAVANDNVFAPLLTDGCETFINAEETEGKIALVDRGGCDFSTKALRAQQAGAIGVIICNFEDDLTNMNPGQDGSSVNIPVVFIQNSDCAVIRQFAGSGLEVSLVQPDFGQTVLLDGDLDNAIIAHEYAHGISSRLTCGPSGVGLLNNEIRDGEGWSDFIALAVTAKPGDTGEMRRGLGTYVFKQENDGRGVRRYPYSTDMEIDPLTYKNSISTDDVYAPGEVLASVLWDMYWAFVDEYGFDTDIYEGTGGNNQAVRLVFEGLKNQPCSPGFIDIRDAILAADEELYNGENLCRIWEVFARRGIGFSADQGDPFSGTDQVESFDPLPACVKELKITKTVSPLVNAGDDIEVRLLISNDKDEAVSGLNVTDIIPEGTSFIAASSNLPATENGDEINFEVANLGSGENLEITYRLSTPAEDFSVRRFYDDFEGDLSSYANNTFSEEDITNAWQWTTSQANSGLRSYFVLNVGIESQDALFRLQPLTVDGENPVIRFYHRYDTQAGVDAGLFEVTSVEDPLTGLWDNAGPLIFREGYPLPVDYQTFITPNLEGFSGDSDAWVATYVDVSDYAGQEIFLRWRFGTNNSIAGTGWYVDDIELLNMKNYISEACVSSVEGDNACDSPEGRGTIIESQVVTSTFTPVSENLEVAVYPNPASEIIFADLRSSQRTDVELRLISAAGQIVRSQNSRIRGEARLQVQTSDLARGIYFMEIQTSEGVYTEKVVLR